MAIRKPKKLKLPKKPKQSASNAVLENYLTKVASIKKENARRESQYKKDLSKRNTLVKKIQNANK